MLTDHFPYQQQMIDHMSSHCPSSSIEYIQMMFSKTIALTTRSQAYDETPKKKDEGASPEKTPPVNPSHPPPSNGPLTIEKPIFDMILSPPKSTICRNVLNPSARAAQFYNAVEYLAQSPIKLST